MIEVPDEKRGKNRIHFDIQPRAGTRDEEVRRVVALGATQVADHRDHHGPGIGWVVLQDPEGNEFCILRSEEERSACWPASSVVPWPTRCSHSRERGGSRRLLGTGPGNGADARI